MTAEELKLFLEDKVRQYKTIDFVQEDPIQIPKMFSGLQDREISAFFAATVAWGNRKSIIADAKNILDIMDNAPYDFVLNATPKDFPKAGKSLHRTFMTEDFKFLVEGLKLLYTQQDSLEHFFLPKKEELNMMEAIERFRAEFTIKKHRGLKHISSPQKNSAAKRLHMFLRWMVRKDAIDLGIWQNISASKLSLPLDVHTANISRKLGLLQRKQNDRKAVEEVDVILRKFDPNDPVKYDFALFGFGVYEKF